MDPLKISGVELDDRDPYRATFNVRLSRDMTDFERQALPPLLSGRFSSSEARGAAVVAIRNSTIAMIEDHRDLLKQIVAEAESLARQWKTINMRWLPKSRQGWRMCASAPQLLTGAEATSRDESGVPAPGLN
ncbi:MAG: hypothetical protein ACRDUT_20000 [Mycobacterium sp.]